mmetsp:Transcript_103624/g.322967  ORF Transcript_103624/g.322967 Transcript_103624/m.322967 type:complete len:201 (+) Transcript_103624:1790-2392(+)
MSTSWSITSCTSRARCFSPQVSSRSSLGRWSTTGATCSSWRTSAGASRAPGRAPTSGFVPWSLTTWGASPWSGSRGSCCPPRGSSPRTWRACGAGAGRRRRGPAIVAAWRAWSRGAAAWAACSPTTSVASCCPSWQCPASFGQPRTLVTRTSALMLPTRGALRALLAAVCALCCSRLLLAADPQHVHRLQLLRGLRGVCL